jgi:hypothetical protein
MLHTLYTGTLHNTSSRGYSTVHTIYRGILHAQHIYTPHTIHGGTPLTVQRDIPHTPYTGYSTHYTGRGILHTLHTRDTPHTIQAGGYSTHYTRGYSANCTEGYSTHSIHGILHTL